MVRREFPTQTVVLNLRTGRYHGLNPTAAQMLSVLEQGASVAAAARLIAERCRQPQSEVERDIRELCTSLLERGLVELDEPTAAVDSAPRR